MMMYRIGLLFCLLMTIAAWADGFFEPFDSGERIPEYRIWFPTGKPGKAEFDATVGHEKPGSLCLSGAMRGAVAVVMPVADNKGGLYRFSAWVRGEEKGMGTFCLKLWPSLKERGEVPPYGSTSLPLPIEQTWQYHEVVFRIPQECKYADTTINAIAGQVILLNFTGKVFIDEIRLEPALPCGDSDCFYEQNFTDEATADAWGLYGSEGIEGVTKVERVADGCGDAGAIAIHHVSGKSGYGAAPKQPLACPLGAPDKQPSGKDNALTLELSVKQEGGASAVLVVEQLDAQGKLLETTTGNPVPAAPDYRMATLPFTLRIETAALRPAVLNAGTGTVIIDNIVLRPADKAEKLTLSRVKKEPLWSIVYPADFFATIDRKEPVISLLSGRTNFILVMLAGDKTLAGSETLVDFTLPESIEVLTAQFSTYGPTYTVEELPPARPGYRTYRVRNPYDWARYMMKTNPNHYSGLQIVMKANGNPGDKGLFTLELTVGDKKGERREIPMEILRPAPVAPLQDWFTVGSWGFIDGHVIDEAAHKALIESFVASGFNHGSVHASQKYASERVVKLGFQPNILIHSPDYAKTYKDPPRRTLADGREDKAHVALGALLTDQQLQAQYRKYVASCVKLLPPTGRAFANIDIEYWGTGVCTSSCFHPTSIAAFRTFAKLGENVQLDSSIILRDYKNEWIAFRNDITVKFHRMARDILHELRPNTLLCAYDYTLNLDGTPSETYLNNVPTNSLLYDQQDAIDAHLVSTYSIEGVNFLDHIDCDSHTFKKPVYGVPYLTEALPNVLLPSWNYHHPSVREVRLEVLAAAASGAAGLSYFTGKAVDGERLNAINEGMNAVGRFAAFYKNGKRADDSVKLEGITPDMRHRVHILDGKSLLTLFNCASSPQTITLPNGAKLTVPPMDFVQTLL